MRAVTSSDPLWSRLSAYLAGHHPGRAWLPVGPLVPLAGGWGSSLYTFTPGNEESRGDPATALVLKTYAPDELGREHATREGRALARLRAAGLSVPRVLVVEPDARHLGRPFVVMEHLVSTPLWQVYEVAGREARAQLTRSFVAQLVALHALDPRVLEPAPTPPHAYEHIEDELERLRRDCTGSPHVGLMEVVRWLERRAQTVPCEQPVILHRDFHPWNVLVDAAGHLWTVDWDWRVGDARFDLAWTRTLVERSGFHEFRDAVRDEYARQSHRSLHELGYFEVLATTRWLLNVLPSTRAGGPPTAAAREDFRLFLVGPVHEARRLLLSITGTDVEVQV